MRELTLIRIAERLERVARWAPTEVFCGYPNIDSETCIFEYEPERKAHCPTCDCRTESRYRIRGCSAIAAVLIPSYKIKAGTWINDADFWEDTDDPVDMMVDLFPRISPGSLPCGHPPLVVVDNSYLNEMLCDYMEEDYEPGYVGHCYGIGLDDVFAHLQTAHRWTRIQIAQWLRASPAGSLHTTVQAWYAALRLEREKRDPAQR